MTQKRLESLKDLVQCQENPCISIYMSTEAVHQGDFKKLEIEFKNLLKEVEKKLEKHWDFKKREVEKLLKEAYSLAEDTTFWQKQRESIAVFISPNKFDYYLLASDSYNKTHVSYGFNLKQLAAAFREDQQFYLLALSPNYNRLYQVRANNIEELEVEGLPENVKEFLNLDEQAAEKYQAASSAGSTSIFHGQGAAADQDNQDLIRYFREINKIIEQELEDDYLLLAVDDSVFSIYQDVNSYDHLLADHLSGNIRDLNKKELRQKSWQIVEAYFKDDLKNIKNKYLDLKSSDKAAADLNKIVEAAHHSKIDTLFVNKKAEKSGIFSEAENEVVAKDAAKDYDLYNLAVVQTVLNGGDVYVLDKDDMPEQNDIAAVYRY